MSLGQTHFVPGTNPVCPRDLPGVSQEQPDQKIYVYVPFSCLRVGDFLGFRGILGSLQACGIVTPSRDTFSRAALKGTNPRGQTPICGFLQVPAVFCGFQRKSAAFCENLRSQMLHFLGKGEKQQKSAKMAPLRARNSQINFSRGAASLISEAIWCLLLTPQLVRRLCREMLYFHEKR